MVRPQCPTYAVPVGFPVFGLAFTTTNQLLVGGGGGAGRSGIQNKLVSYRVEPRRKDLEEEAVYEFSNEEDAPMCLDVHPVDDTILAGVNASEEDIKKGKNSNCRVFKAHEATIELVKSMSTLDSKNPDDYQKAVRFCADGSLFATGTSNGQVNVYNYPDYTPLCDTIQVSEDDEVMDVDISNKKDKLVALTRDAIKLASLRGRHTGKVMQTISSPALDKKQKLQFRAFRYGRLYSKESAYLVGNSKSGGHLLKLDAYTLEVISNVKISKKPITSFCLSREGGMAVVATADFSVIIMDATTLRVLHTVKEAHGFSITSIAISPDRLLLATGSADNSCRVVSLPQQFPSSAAAVIHPLKTVLLAVIVSLLLVAILRLFDSYYTDTSAVFNETSTD
ncbi:hypothetical protein O0I10_000900 [Lichtheimia ornata]|uniref:Uncharacterized protein n=1 Tax=Lichtheimia ornata TaxID=688661 RepID=A0AAD7Y4I3_9FUNG|nr:uncharacterized protein O0I10_000900 [Lichtheimia ornata]KAJ8663652.1 hypothetical protein O0I10_000900 [Lichtheimia ornata]